MTTIKLDLTMKEAVHVWIALDLVVKLSEQAPGIMQEDENRLPVLKRYLHVIEAALKAKGANYAEGRWTWPRR